jgi:hypothetical protein
VTASDTTVDDIYYRVFYTCVNKVGHEPVHSNVHRRPEWAGDVGRDGPADGIVESLLYGIYRRRSTILPRKMLRSVDMLVGTLLVADDIGSVLLTIDVQTRVG